MPVDAHASVLPVTFDTPLHYMHISIPVCGQPQCFDTLQDHNGERTAYNHSCPTPKVDVESPFVLQVHICVKNSVWLSLYTGTHTFVASTRCKHKAHTHTYTHVHTHTHVHTQGVRNPTSRPCCEANLPLDDYDPQLTAPHQGHTQTPFEQGHGYPQILHPNLNKPNHVRHTQSRGNFELLDLKEIQIGESMCQRPPSRTSYSNIAAGYRAATLNRAQVSVGGGKSLYHLFCTFLHLFARVRADLPGIRISARVL